MIRKIVVASEIIPNADEMFQYLGGLRRFGAKKCILVQCINQADTPKEAPKDVSEFIDAIMEENLQSQKKILEEQGFEVTCRVCSGFIRQEINKIAIEERADLIVAAARREDRITGYPFDDAAYEVIQNAGKPVLLIRIYEDEKQEQDLTEHVLFATDFSDNAGVAFQSLEELAESGIGKVSLIHVQEKTRIEPHLIDKLEDFNRIDQERLDSLKERLILNGCHNVETYILYGSTKYELNKFIREHNVTLTIMGSQGRGFIDELFVGGVSQNIARESISSVLLIPTVLHN
ncbi:MAG: universal stress protein [Lachnospiraceae bacterium]|nr:universal stress protein [Lachnospiraceae bacterium]MDD3660717.1 universal stress protein [Lachnospiraceae bacterium]